MKFAPGEVLVRRYWRGGHLQRLYLVRVAADDERGLRLWFPAGSPWWRRSAPDEDEAAEHDAPADTARGRLVRQVSTGPDVLVWLPEQAPYAVSWLWDDGHFAGWRVTLEEPYVRWADRGCAGVDTVDHSVDLVVRPDHTWRWQARGEHGQPVAVDPLDRAHPQAAQVRPTAERLVKLVEARQFPFDGTWRGFRPDASWTVPALPPGYDRPRAVARP
ncbi:MAG: DUF402 domain-containing protein [Micromonosporaceae bacterium]|nr:DUF402 domain-containing protein [Micromonosporaceae bacterium]